MRRGQVRNGHLYTHCLCHRGKTPKSLALPRLDVSKQQNMGGQRGRIEPKGQEEHKLIEERSNSLTSSVTVLKESSPL